jgi:hypothetical protein
MLETLVYHRICFTHINKCAGTSIKRWLDYNHLQRDSAKHQIVGYDYESRGRDKRKYINQILFKSKIGVWDGKEKPTLIKTDDNVLYLTMVRNPYDRMASHFFQWERNRFFNKNCFDINSFISTLAKFYEKGYSNIKIIINNSTDDMFIHGGTPSFRYRPAIDKRFIMPCTYWIRDMDRFKVFRLEYDGLNKLQTFITTKLPIGRTHDGKYGSMINDPLSNILDMKHNHNPDLPNLFADKRINNYMHLYNKKSIDIINNLFHSDFETFGYEKK